MEKMVQEDTTAETVIHFAFEQYGASQETLSYLDSRKETLKAAERQKVAFYIGNYREIFRNMISKKLGGNTAGLYDGSEIYLDESIPTAGKSVEEMVAIGAEVYEHEKYHKKNDHTAPLEIVGDTRAGVAAVIGGQEFSETELIEGLTVMQTGNTFVSEEYVGHERALDRAISASGQTVGDVEKAVNKVKDLTLIDDRTRKTGAPAPVLSV